MKHEDSITNSHANLPPKSTRKQINVSVNEAVKSRSDAMRSSRKITIREFGRVLDTLDNCIALGELLHEQVEDTFARGRDVLISKVPRPRAEVVTGAPLKCLLLFGLHARSCIIANEISILLRNGFPDGADSRLRTLHEHAVMMTIIGNDGTYAVAERYQDHAVSEYLRQLRSTKRSFEDPYWNLDSVARYNIDQDIAALEASVREAKARWGSDVTEQYGWARPALPVSKQGKREVTFAELESAAGMSFVRADYLEENNHVHAGPQAIISSADWGDHIYALHPLMPRHRIYRAADRLTLVFGFISYALATIVAREAGDLDGVPIADEMSRFVSRASRKMFNWNTVREGEIG